MTSCWILIVLTFSLQYGLTLLSSSKPLFGKVLAKRFPSFLFVRDPYTRLVSAYRNKINPGRVYDQLETGRRIVQLFRPNATRASLQAGNDVTFPEFVKFIIYLYYKDEIMDEHWRPQYSLSLPCIVPYTFIGKMETMATDIKYVLQNLYKVNVSDFSFILNQKPSTTNITYYYSQIPKYHLSTLKQIYMLDFQLFGYDIDVI